MDVHSLKLVLGSVQDDNIRNQIMNPLEGSLASLTMADINDIFLLYDSEESKHAIVVKLITLSNVGISIDDVRDFLGGFVSELHRVQLLCFFLERLGNFDPANIAGVIGLFPSKLGKLSALKRIMHVSPTVNPCALSEVLAVFDASEHTAVLGQMLDKISIKLSDVDGVCKDLHPYCRTLLLSKVTHDTFENPDIRIDGETVNKFTLAEAVPTYVNGKYALTKITRQEDVFIVSVEVSEKVIRMTFPLNAKIDISLDLA